MARRQLGGCSNGLSVWAPLAIMIVVCIQAATVCTAFAPSKLQLHNRHHHDVATRPSSSSLQALPIIDAASATSSFLIASEAAATSNADAAAAAAAAAANSESILNSILHTPTLWSVLAMMSIVALLVVWEEAIE